MNTAEKKQLRVFGYGLAVILAFIGYRVWAKHGWIPAHAFLGLASAVLVLLTSLRLAALKPFYIQWMKVAHGIGIIITGIILAVFFYLVFGIVGIILRLLRKDLLDRRIEPGRHSYWHPRTAVFDKGQCTKQF